MSASEAEDTVEMAGSVGCPPCRPPKRRRHTHRGSAALEGFVSTAEIRRGLPEEDEHSMLYKPRGRLAALRQVLDERKKFDKLHCQIYQDLLKEHRQLQAAHQALRAQQVHDMQQAQQAHDAQQAQQALDMQQAQQALDLQQAQNAHDMQEAQQAHDRQQAQQVHDMQQAQQAHDMQLAQGQQAQGEVASGPGASAGAGCAACADSMERLQQEVALVQQREAASLAQFCQVAMRREGMLTAQLQAASGQLAGKLAQQGEEVQQQRQLAAQAQAALEEGRQQWECERRQLYEQLAAAAEKSAAGGQQRQLQGAPGSDLLACTMLAEPAAAAAAGTAGAAKRAPQAAPAGLAGDTGPATPAGVVALAAAGAAAPAGTDWDRSCCQLDPATVAAAAEYARATHIDAGIPVAALASTLLPATATCGLPATAAQAASGSTGSPEAAAAMGSGSGSGGDSGVGDEDAAALAAAISAALTGSLGGCDWLAALEAPHTSSLPMGVVEDLLR